MSKNLSYYFLCIPPLFYLNIFGYDNIGSILSLVGLTIAIIFYFPFNLSLNQKKITLLFFIFIFIFYLFSNNILLNPQLNAFSGTYWWIYLFISILIFSPPPKRLLEKLSHCTIITSIFILLLDCYYRFFINTIEKNDVGRYAYKFGLIDMDSNFSGIYASLIFFYCLFLRKVCYKYTLIYMIVLYMLVLSSLSLAAISITTILFIYFRLSKKIKIYLLPIGIFCMILSSSFIIHMIEMDGSGSTKINFIKRGFEMLISRDIFTTLFGTGLFSVKLNGYDPHIVILQLLLQLGLIGFILYYLIQFILIINYKRILIYVVLPFFLIGLSVASISSPIFTTIIILLYYQSFYIQNDDSKFHVPYRELINN
ncbi:MULTISPECIES: hypothetical protein [unclassified Providencia]|uniref:hypothetical protein n=1 Tax=unclassified Providencia TaxID=2633465 RepID=UPI00298FD088|nr:MULTISPECIES: hypothetical protein [unclassified Providencia]